MYLFILPKLPRSKALCTALGRVFCDDREAVIVGMPMDVRTRCNLPENELMNAGCPSGVVVSGHSLPFWEAVALTASKVGDDLDSARNVVQQYAKTLEANRDKLLPLRKAADIEIPFIISNLGRCALPGVEALIGMIGRGHQASMQMHVHTINDKRCFISFNFMSPLYSRVRMVDGVKQALRLLQ